MTVKRARRGETRWVIDIRYTDGNGKRRRYRRDAQVQTRAGKEAEERRIRENIALHGSVFESKPEPANTARETTFKEATGAFMDGPAISQLKHTTRAGYREIIETRLLPRFGAIPIETITFAVVQRLDADMVEEGLSPSRRRNTQIVIRSILRSAVDTGKLADMPRLPPLPKVGRRVLRRLTADQVNVILAVAAPAQRVPIALAAYAGLRAGEVRALEWGDVELNTGVIIVRRSTSRGETSTPKSGHEREIPIAAPLREILLDAGHRRGLVASNRR